MVMKAGDEKVDTGYVNVDSGNESGDVGSCESRVLA